MKAAIAIPSAAPTSSAPSIPRPRVAIVPRPSPRSEVPAPAPKSAPPPLPERARQSMRMQAQAPVSTFRPVARPKDAPNAGNAATVKDAKDARPVARPSEELVPVLFEQMHELAFADDALVAARFCLSVVGELIPCRAAMVHLFDIERREFIVVDATGAHADDLRLTKQAANDPLLRVAMVAKTPLTWGRMPDTVTQHIDRLAPLGNVREILAAPILSGARWLGCIELVDPENGSFGVGHENALAYVADGYARFLGEHGVIVDVGAIARFALR